MSRFIATYDLRETNPSPHSTFLDQATKNGWAIWILSDKNEWYRLPNTTLVGEFNNRDAAVAALKATRSAAEKALGRAVTMEKWIVTDYTSATLDSDVHHPKK